MLKLSILFLLLGGCAVSIEAPEPMPHAPITLGYVACTTVTGDVADDCAPGQTSVTRCTQATENRDEKRCTGPVGLEVQPTGKVWCCLPADVAAVSL